MKIKKKVHVAYLLFVFCIMDHKTPNNRKNITFKFHGVLSHVAFHANFPKKWKLNFVNY